MNRAFVFPGQGSQAIGMGRELAETYVIAREVFEEVDDALGRNLSRLMFHGEHEELMLTENAQPALMAVSVAAFRVLVTQAGKSLPELSRFVAGHSLGEYSALTAAGALDVADAARLLKLRGQAMQMAVPVGVGAMAALMGVDYDLAVRIASEAALDEVCAAANDNAPGQVVISGHKTAVERAVALAAQHGYRRSLMLPVSAPFHCPLMAPAAQVMAEALAEVAVRPPAVPLIANVIASAVSDPDEIRRLLVRQVTGDVRWRESVLYMKEHGVTMLVEIGAGRVLSGLAKRIDRAMSATSVHTPAEIDALLESLN